LRTGEPALASTIAVGLLAALHRSMIRRVGHNEQTQHNPGQALRRVWKAGRWRLPWRVRLPVYFGSAVVAAAVAVIFVSETAACIIAGSVALIITKLVENRTIAGQWSAPHHWLARDS
jgi:protein-S-isoprenylcysteine O-methyltransferase Ste14